MVVEAHVSGFVGEHVYAPVMEGSSASSVIRRHERQIGGDLNSVDTIGWRKIHAVARTMGMDLTHQPDSMVNRDVGNVVEELRVDVDIVFALLDQGTPKANQVRDVCDLAIVLAQPEDDPFVAAGAVVGHFVEGVVYRGFR